MLPSIDSIRCFVAAARTLNFRAASRTVGLTPAALGKRIQQLEEQLGAPLFHRTTRKVELTEAGLALLPRAQALLMAAEACINAVSDSPGLPPMELLIGTRHELGLSWLVPMLPKLRQSFPQWTFHVYFGSGPDIELRVRTMEIDCAISSRAIQDGRVDGLRVHREDYALVGAPTLLEHTPLGGIEDAAHHTLVDAHPELPLFRYFQSAQEDREQWRFANVIRMGTIEAIRALVLSGEGVGVLPRYLVEPDLSAGRLKQILPDAPVQHDHFRLMFRRDDPRRAAFEALAEVLREEPLK